MTSFGLDCGQCPHQVSMILLVETMRVKYASMSPDRTMAANLDGEPVTPASQDPHVPTHHTGTHGVTVETKQDKTGRMGRASRTTQDSTRIEKGRGKKLQKVSYLGLDLQSRLPVVMGEGIHNRFVVVGGSFQKLTAHFRRPKDLFQGG